MDFTRTRTNCKYVNKCFLVSAEYERKTMWKNELAVSNFWGILCKT